MKLFLLPAMLLSVIAASAQEVRQTAPVLNYKVVEDFFKVPDNHLYAEAVGVAIKSNGHIFTLNRGNHPIEEFNPDGSFVRSFGEEAQFIHAPHTIRFDKDDNLWYVDAGNNLVVKFDKNLRIKEVVGSRPEPWVFLTHGIERAAPPPDHFYQPTDTAIGPDGSLYVTDGYGNSRVVKFSSTGTLMKYWGDRGTGNGQFNTPHSIVIDNNANLYVADRQNNRVQVFDTDGKFKAVYRLPGPTWSLCITPGANQVMFVGSAGALYKLGLDGKILAEVHKPGLVSGYLSSIHSLACPDEKTLYVAQEWVYRFDKLEIQ
jgi:DNA-binding beta-propeller fold protein YncE